MLILEKANPLAMNVEVDSGNRAVDVVQQLIQEERRSVHEDGRDGQHSKHEEVPAVRAASWPV